MGDQAPDPFTPMAAGAVQMHEMYTGLQSAGFTKEEALYMIVCIASNNPISPPPPGSLN